MIKEIRYRLKQILEELKTKIYSFRKIYFIRILILNVKNYIRLENWIQKYQKYSTNISTLCISTK